MPDLFPVLAEAKNLKIAIPLNPKMSKYENDQKPLSEWNILIIFHVLIDTDNI